ncbi:MAG: diacylglycerol kinase family lipid kinase [Bacteroidales bacterium]|nr:diacylglycerol kinase family lipid kinase [Bacteroidales bacterium]
MKQKITFIINPISGNKDKSKVLSSIGRHLDTALYNAEVIMTEGPGEAERIARESTSPIVVAVGGDGTVNEVARGIVGSDKILGIIPCGSGDGLALHLGISRRIASAVKVLNKGCHCKIDIATINGRYFLCTAGFGLDAKVSQEFAKSSRRGLARYIHYAWNEWKNNPVGHYTVTSESESWTGDAIFVTVANANQWGNQAKIAPLASIRDGLLDVMVVRPFHTLEIPSLVRRLMTGYTHTSNHVLRFVGKRFHIERASSGPVHYDGDPFPAGTSFDLEIIPQAISVLVPHSKLRSI